MKKYWNYLKIGFKGWITAMLSQIVVFLPLAFILTLMGFDIMDYSATWIIVMFIIGLILQWTVNGYFNKRFWGWK